jgi:hypothetical protein
MIASLKVFIKYKKKETHSSVDVDNTKLDQVGSIA